MSQHPLKGRRYPRFEVHDVEGQVLYTLQAEVINLSVAGMAIESSRPLTVGRIYDFSIRHCDEIGRVHLSGAVVWCKLSRTRRKEADASAAVYQSGISFVDVLSENAHSLLHLIGESATLDVNRRVFGRFTPGPETRVMILSEIRFEVQKSRLGGMLIETGLLAEQEDFLPMEIELPQGRVTFIGRVAYVKPLLVEQGEPLRYHLGIEFHDLMPESKEVLELFIANMVEHLSGDTSP